ncbi:MAG: hypothetical protein RR327_04820 [Clostridia bacterium]
MLTTGREINSKKDREGAFERKSYNVETTLGLDSGVANLNNIRSVDSTVENGLNTKQTPQVTPKASVKLGEKKKLRISDNYAQQVSKSKIVAGVAPREKMTARNIVMVCVYCLVVVALVAVIALNANALTSISAKNADLRTSIEELNATYSVLSSELTALNDPTRLSELAMSTLGLTAETSGVKVIELSMPKVLPRVEAVHKTNWFDSLCDEISSFIGG